MLPRTMGLVAIALVAAASAMAQGTASEPSKGTHMARGVLKSVYAHALADCRADARFKGREGACPAYATCVAHDVDLKLTQEQAMAAVHDKDTHLADSLPIRRWKAVSDRCHASVTSEFRN